MIFWILWGIVAILVVGVFLAESNDAGVASGLGVAFFTLLLGFFGSAIVLLIFAGGTEVTDRTYAEPVGVTTYELAEGSKVTEDGEVEFIYLEDGEPKQFSEYLESLTVEGSSGTVEIKEVKYEHGNSIFPWGYSEIEKYATVK